MPEDPLYHSLVDSTKVLTQVLTRLDATHRFALRLQAYALTLLGGMLLLFGYVISQHFAQSQEHAVHTQALIEMLQRLPKP